MSEPTPAHPMESLPYLDEYLTMVLRPRVETAVRAAAAELHDAAWDTVLDSIVAEQRTPMDAEVLRRLLKERLHLKLLVSVEADFGEEDGKGDTRPTPAGAAIPAPSPQNGAPRGHGNSDEVEVVDQPARRRPPMNPLANAMLGSIRRPT